MNIKNGPKIPGQVSVTQPFLTFKAIFAVGPSVDAHAQLVAGGDDIQLVVLFLIAGQFHWEVAEVMIGSKAGNVVPTSGTGIASAKGQSSRIASAKSVVIFGYVVAKPIGVMIYRLLN